MSEIAIPRDDAYLPNLAGQWWYWTGHLRGSTTGHDYGFFLAFFVLQRSLVIELGLDPSAIDILARVVVDPGSVRLVVAQGAVTDVAADRFEHRIVPWPIAPERQPDRFELQVPYLSASGGNGRDRLGPEQALHEAL